MSPARFSVVFLALAAAIALSPAPSFAQGAAPGARPGATQGETPRPQRQRSPAQLRNDQIMRDCGAEWRASRAQLTQQGKTWRTFLPECRQRRRA